MRCGINNPTHNSDWSWIKRPNALKYIIWSMCWGVLTVVKTLLGPTSRWHHSASWRQNKANTGGGPFKTVLIRPHTELKIYFCCDVGCKIRCWLQFEILRDTCCHCQTKNPWQLWLNKIKRAHWTEIISHFQRTLIRKG